MQILDKQLTLVLNKHWMPIGCRSIKEAITCLCSESHGDHPALALDIEMVKDDNGEDVLLYATPTKWEDWVDLDIRDEDLYISTSSKKIRAPLVIITCNYDKMPMKKPRLSIGNIWARDNGVCQYTGKKLSKSQGNIDHIIPRDKGGRDEWTNMVLSDRNVNSKKGNRLNHEAGLKLIREPKAPLSVPASLYIREANHPYWSPFLAK